jgi:hypothetical protein
LQAVGHVIASNPEKGEKIFFGFYLSFSVKTRETNLGICANDNDFLWIR